MVKIGPVDAEIYCKTLNVRVPFISRILRVRQSLYSVDLKKEEIPEDKIYSPEFAELAE